MSFLAWPRIAHIETRDAYEHVSILRSYFDRVEDFQAHNRTRGYPEHIVRELMAAVDNFFKQTLQKEQEKSPALHPAKIDMILDKMHELEERVRLASPSRALDCTDEDRPSRATTLPQRNEEVIRIRTPSEPNATAPREDRMILGGHHESLWVVVHGIKTAELNMTNPGKQRFIAQIASENGFSGSAITYVGWLSKSNLYKTRTSIVLGFDRPEQAIQIVNERMVWKGEHYSTKLYDHRRLPRCFKCHAYGHSGTRCQIYEPVPCAICAGDHEMEACDQRHPTEDVQSFRFRGVSGMANSTVFNGSRAESRMDVRYKDEEGTEVWNGSIRDREESYTPLSGVLAIRNEENWSRPAEEDLVSSRPAKRQRVEGGSPPLIDGMRAHDMDINTLMGDVDERLQFLKQRIEEIETVKRAKPVRSKSHIGGYTRLGRYPVMKRN